MVINALRLTQSRRSYTLVLICSEETVVELVVAIRVSGTCCDGRLEQSVIFLAIETERLGAARAARTSVVPVLIRSSMTSAVAATSPANRLPKPRRNCGGALNAP